MEAPPMTWNLSEAKNKLSEVLDRATHDGPQTIRRRDESFVVMPEADYERLAGRKPSFKDWLLNGPSLEGVDLERDKSPMREVEL
jgi:antitoxin Phd